MTGFHDIPVTRSCSTCIHRKGDGCAKPITGEVGEEYACDGYSPDNRYTVYKDPYRPYGK